MERTLTRDGVVVISSILPPTPYIIPARHCKTVSMLTHYRLVGSSDFGITSMEKIVGKAGDIRNDHRRGPAKLTRRETKKKTASL